MDRFELQKLRDLPIEGVAERLGLRVVRHKCLCPFHDDHHASMSFKVSKNMFRCFVCGASGGTIDLVMKYLRKDFKEACQWLGGADFRVLKDFKDSKDLKVKAPPAATRASSSARGSRPRHDGFFSTNDGSTQGWCAGADSPHGATSKACLGCRYLIIIVKGNSSASKTATSASPPRGI